MPQSVKPLKVNAELPAKCLHQLITVVTSHPELARQLRSSADPAGSDP
jgi:hypothetical protein